MIIILNVVLVVLASSTATFAEKASSSSSYYYHQNNNNRLPVLDIYSGIQSLVVPKMMDLEKECFQKLIQKQRNNQKELMLYYGIFKGISSLREFKNNNNNEQQRLVLLEEEQNLLYYTKTIIAILLLLHGYTDASHEVMLGVTFNNIDNAEYAATHPGETSWSTDHPLSDSDDILHSIIHRLCEGELHGEGGYTGWDNALYWAAGGPKMLYSNNNNKENNDEGTIIIQEHPIRTALAKAALQYAKNCCKHGVVVTSSENNNNLQQQHEIIAGRGATRTVTVPCNWWDPFCFIKLIQKENCDNDLRQELDWLQELELRLLLRYELLLLLLLKQNDEMDHVDLVSLLLTWEKEK